MNIDGAFPSKWLKAADIPAGQNLNLHMSHVEIEQFDDGSTKPVLYFQGKEKGLVMNKTNSAIVKSAYGVETEAWEGKPVILVSTQTMFKGQEVPCLRLRIPANAQAAPPPEEPPGQDDDIPF